MLIHKLFDCQICLMLVSFAKQRKATINFIMSVCLILCSPFRLSAWNHLSPTRRIFMKFDIVFIENMIRKFEFDWILKRKTIVYMRTNIHIWSYIAQFFLERKILSQVCWENRNTHFTFTNFLPKVEKTTGGNECGACALRSGYVCLQTHARTHPRTHALTIYNIYCSSTEH
jgi:hypothetical protein